MKLRAGKQNWPGFGVYLLATVNEAGFNIGACFYPAAKVGRVTEKRAFNLIIVKVPYGNPDFRWHAHKHRC